MKIIPIKTVIFKFKHASKAERFFGLFSDKFIKDPEKEEKIRNAVDTLMEYCNIDILTTKQDPEYGAAFVECEKSI